MSRNQNSLFSTLPSVNISRSRFKRDSGHTFTGNVGSLIPFFVEEILPGDTAQIKTSKVVRLQTPITPFMGQLYLDTYYFFVPNRLVWSHWKEFNGENTAAPWVPGVSYTVPKLKLGSSISTYYKGSAVDYMGVPCVAGLEVNALPFRAYSLIWQEWFRDENLQYPPSTYIGDNSGNTQNNINVPVDGSSAVYIQYGYIASVAKFHDYFTSALPYPLKNNNDVTIQMLNAPVPVTATGDPISVTGTGTSSNWTIGTPLGTSAPNQLNLLPYNQSAGNISDLSFVDPGLEVDLTGVSIATINQLRTAFQLQKLYEADARGGSRYTEILRQHFGVISPDARLQRPEYLGGNRIPINVNQVVQTSETGNTPQGTTGAYSLTVDQHGEFIRSFTEHGFIIGVCCVRYNHVYQQGLEKFWSRNTRFDYYWPVFAHLGEQPILNKEIYAQGPSVKDSDQNVIDEQVFGYQEAWADYRYKPSRISGEMRSNISNSLDFWHLADDYNSLPALSAGWIAEDKSNVDRVLQVTSSVSDQLLFDFWIENTMTRPMPLHSVPGLVDHF